MKMRGVLHSLNSTYGPLDNQDFVGFGSIAVMNAIAYAAPEAIASCFILTLGV
ncbi:MAG: hypothetical protein MET45_01940 [Nostoc sp. LLA-1]|nr:hypothetical protein [Cyanocohniella sp. LLY]